MASVSVSQKSKEELKNSCNELRDRLSSLPDEILIHMLSFLPTKYGVRTCILSKRWVMLWASVPVLDFEQERLSPSLMSEFGINALFLDQEQEDYHMMRRKLISKYFIEFVEHVLHSNNMSHIRRFRLKAHDIDISYLIEWVSFTIRRHVQQIEFDLRWDLPKRFYTLGNLDAIHFPSLKIFHVSLRNCIKDLGQKLFSSCPLLEELFINMYIDQENGMTLDVSAPALKRLKIHLEENDLFDSSEYMIVISASKLEQFSLSDSKFPIILMEESRSLVKAEVSIGSAYPMWKTAISETRNRLRPLLRGISNVKVLSLSTRGLAHLNYDNANDMPVFGNLTCLRVDMVDRCDLRVLPYLLKCTPNLQNLSLNGMYVCYPDSFSIESVDLKLPDQVPDCLLFQLQLVEFIDLMGDRDELEVLKYFLKNAKVLKKLSVLFNKDFLKGVRLEERKKQIPRTLLSLRASKMLHVVELKDYSDSQYFKWD